MARKNDIKVAFGSVINEGRRTRHWFYRNKLILNHLFYKNSVWYPIFWYLWATSTIILHVESFISTTYHYSFLITISGTLLEKYEFLKQEKETLAMKTRMKKRKLVWSNYCSYDKPCRDFHFLNKFDLINWLKQERIHLNVVLFNMHW